MAGSETVTIAGSGVRRVPLAALAVGALVVLSTIVRFAVAQSFTTPWIAPDEMVYGLIGETLWSEGTLTVRGLPTPYYSILTPALIGAPLAAFDLAEGIEWARLLQALAASLVAVPTYRWARRMMSERWALVAATLTLLAPALHYAGFLMTEPLTLTLVTAALLALARAVEDPSTWRYGVFAGWATAAAAVRLQALVLVPTVLLAVLLDAAAARDRRRLQPLLWLAGASILVVVTIGVVLVASGGDLSTERILGAYTPVSDAGGAATVDASGILEIVWHGFDVAILGLGIPVLAFAAVAYRIFAGRDGDPSRRAFVSVALAYAVLLVLQVGLFAAEFVGHVAERYLITVVPLLAIALCAWIATGAPRDAAVVLPVWAALVLAAAFVPITHLATSATLVNTLTPAPLVELSQDDARLALIAAALAAGAVVMFVPRRRAWVAAAIVGLGLALVSADTAQRIADESTREDHVAAGTEPPSWLDSASVRDATLLVTGDRLWTATARTIFWNRGVREVMRLGTDSLSFPPVTPVLDVTDEGVLVKSDGTPLEREVVVAPSTITLAGEKLAERRVGLSETGGLVAWRTFGPVRLLMRVDGLLPNGDFTGAVRLTLYDCQPGTLDVTILGKSGHPVRAWVDGLERPTLETPAGLAATHHIAAPAYANGSKPCVYDLETDGFAGTTTIGFTPKA
ncbi:MAG TPA: glycosyltransferase family 39 protein [Gaiella sp.]|nr:glycosyltransferase family 39 protein [Gaiella sp.]